MNIISIIFLPLMVLIIIFYGFKKKVNLYDAFTEGAKEGLIMSFKIAPFLFCMVFAINIFLNSDFITFLLGWTGKILTKFNLPIDVLPMAFLRPISGTATLVILKNIFETVGPDSIAGLIGSTIQGSTDTTFYVITLYFGSLGINKIRYSLKVGLFADLIGLIAGFIIIYLMFG